MAKQRLDAARGDTINLRVPVVDQDGAPVDITGAAVRMTVKRNLSDADLSALITRTVGDGVTLTTPEAGIADVTITATQTATLTPAKYYWDVQVTLSGTVSTVAEGYLDVRSDVSITTP